MLPCLLLIFLLIGLTSTSTSGDGCAAPNVLPNKPFLVVWNHPTVGCGQNGFDLGLEKWGIVDNTHDAFRGEDIYLFYDYGLFPIIRNDGRQINGGIPQLANITLHVQRVKQSVSNIKNPAFGGLGVIDWEAWRPMYSLNWGTFRIYQTKSRELVQQKFPTFTPQQVVVEAKKEFNDGAMRVFYNGLVEGRKLRPNGRWGYYGFPRCWDTLCNTTTYTVNDQLHYIYNTSTGLYPSIYFKLGHPTKAQRELHIKRTIHETLRLKAKYAPHNVTIFPYSKNQEGPYGLYTDADLDDAIGEAAQMGAAGVVLWGSSSELRAHNECLTLQHYINSTLGPYVQKLSNFFGNCSDQLCNSHGRCSRKDYEQVYQKHLKESGRKGCHIDEEHLRMKRDLADKHAGDMGGPLKNKERETDFSLRFRFKARNRVKNYLTMYFRKYRRFLKNKTALRVFEKQPGVDQMSVDGDRKENVGYDFDDYVCKCFENWGGKYCNVPV